MNHLHDALQNCSAFVVLVGRDGVRGWVLAETQVALIRHYSPQVDSQRLPIFPVILPNGDIHDLPPFLSLLQAQRWQTSEPLPDNFIAALKDGLERLSNEVVSIEGCPYVGLSAFQREQANLFFGRRIETLQALTYLGAQEDFHPEKDFILNTYYCRWLQIEGNSGVGKSSLVNAGLLPLIEKGVLWARTGFKNWHVLRPMVPGERPLLQLAEILELSLVSDATKRDISRLYQRLKESDDVLALHLRGFRQKGLAFLLVVDQFEELFTFSQDDEKANFDRQLAYALCDNNCPLFLISTIRIDFLGGFEGVTKLSDLYNKHCKRYFLKSISQSGLNEIIEQPARLAGIDVSEVKPAILNDAQNEVGALPLIENALHILWEKSVCISYGKKAMEIILVGNYV